MRKGLKTMKGLPVSQGIGIGAAYLLEKNGGSEFPQRSSDPQKEKARLANAVKRCKDEYVQLRASLGAQQEKEGRLLFAYEQLLDDPSFLSMVAVNIDRGSSAEYAVQQAAQEMSSLLEQIPDPTIRERKDDVLDVGNKLIRCFGEREHVLEQCDVPFIAVAEEFAPTDLIQLQAKPLAGMVAQRGGVNSHVAVLSRASGVPFVILPDILKYVKKSQQIVMDGDSGEVFVEPETQVFKEFQARKQKMLDWKARTAEVSGKPAADQNGKRFHLCCNIGKLSDITSTVEKEADGIGLLRTEFLFDGKKTPPSEEEQFSVYRRAAQAMGDRPLVIRTLDIGGDKKQEYLEIDDEENPFLGYRAIRICLDRPDFFKDQLKAILRASAFGNVKVMFPMISSVNELREAKRIFSLCQSELEAAGQEFHRDMEIGTMIEVPAAAIQADELAREVDFFSIGTNDLLQYTVAADRGNTKVSKLYDPYHPAVLRLIRHVVTCAHRHGKWVGICGEMGAIPQMLGLLLGLGLDEISVSAVSVLTVKYVATRINSDAMAGRVDELLGLASSEEIRRELQKIYDEEIMP